MQAAGTLEAGAVLQTARRLCTPGPNHRNAVAIDYWCRSSAYPEGTGAVPGRGLLSASLQVDVVPSTYTSSYTLIAASHHLGIWKDRTIRILTAPVLVRRTTLLDAGWFTVVMIVLSGE